MAADRDEHVRSGTPETRRPADIVPAGPIPAVAAIDSGAPARRGSSLVEQVRQSRRNAISWVMLLVAVGTVLIFGRGLFEPVAPVRWWGCLALTAAGAISVLAAFSCRWCADLGVGIAASVLATAYLIAYLLGPQVVADFLCIAAGSTVIGGAALITALALEMTARDARRSPLRLPDATLPRQPPAIASRELPALPDFSFTAQPPSPKPSSLPLDEMVDAEIVERPPFSRWAIAAAIVFATTLTGGHVGEWGWAIALGPVCLAFISVFGFRWMFPPSYVLTDDAIEAHRPRRTIRYDDFRWVLAGEVGPHDRFSIFVISDRTNLRIGPSLSCDSQALLNALRRRVPRRVLESDLPATIVSFLAQQRRLHPADRIHIFRNMPRLPTTLAVATFLKLAVSMILPIPIWFLMASRSRGFDPNAWIFSFMPPLMLVLAGAFAVIAGILYANRQSIAGKYNGSCLVVTPDGLAIVQGKLHGEMRWGEIIGGALRPGRGYGDESVIELDVGGTEICIADAYIAAPHQIASLIEAYSGLRLRR